MKTMTCTQLGGACDYKITGETFEEMAQKAQEHGMEMAAAKDSAHLVAMGRMKELMSNPETLQKWMDGRKAAFDSLPEDE